MSTHKGHNMQETSMRSWEDIQSKLGERYKEILDALENLWMLNGDATDQEIKSFLGKLDANYVRPRRFELVNHYKLVGFSQKRKCLVTGKTAMAWKILQGRFSNDKKEVPQMQKGEVINKAFLDRIPQSTIQENLPEVSR